jgi:broad specificity phosphatase PhoE
MTTAATPTRRVFAVSHGETVWSLSGQHTGTTDIPLTENGRRLATRLRPVLVNESFARVFTSPLPCARETCDLAGLATAATVDADLVEWNYGKYEGLTPTQIQATAPPQTWNAPALDAGAVAASLASRPF